MLYSQNILARALMIFIRFRCPVCENNYSRLLNKQNYRLNRYLSTSINKTDPIPSLVRDLVAWRVCLALQATHKMKKSYIYIWHPTQCQYEVTKMTQRTKQVSRLLAKATLPLLTTKSCPWQDRQNTSQHGQCDLRKLHPCNHSLGLNKAYSDAIGSIYMMTKKNDFGSKPWPPTAALRWKIEYTLLSAAGSGSRLPGFAR